MVASMWTTFCLIALAGVGPSLSFFLQPLANGRYVPPRIQSMPLSFAALPKGTTSTSRLQSSSSSSSTTLIPTDDEDVPLILSGNNIELTPALIEYVEKRIGTPLQKLASHGAIRECDVILSVNKNPKVRDAHRVEVITNLKGTTVICKVASPDMYTSIDNASEALKRKLVKYKERRTDGRHGGASMSEDILSALDEVVLEEDDDQAWQEEEGWYDPEKPVVTKVKSFDLSRPISLDEAIFALDYVDHDFYVFRNEETNEISVVYKRHGGGVGLVEP